MINKFRGNYDFLSNFYMPIGYTINFKGLNFPSVEVAYQAAKAVSEEDRRAFLMLCPTEAKAFGHLIEIHSDWDECRLIVMEDMLRQKFFYPELRAKLLATGEQELIEGNTWHDTFFGVCGGVGENHLGKLLMKIRGELAMAEAPVIVTVIDRDLERDTRIYKGNGVYWGSGRLKFTVTVPEGILEMEIDPECFHETEPKRCIRTDKEAWSKYWVRSIVVDSKAILKKAKKP